MTIKSIYLLFLLIPCLLFAQQNLSITKVIESDCSNPFVKTVELYVDGTVDFSSEVQLNYMQNGGLWSDIQIDITALGTVSDSFVYIVRDLALMQAEFPSTTFNSSNTVVVNTATNGNDGYQLVLNGTIVSQFGKTATDADNDIIWEHNDAVASRKPDIVDNGTWDETHWNYTGKNSLDGETSCNGGAGIEAYLANLGGSYPLAYGAGSNGTGTDFKLTANTTGSFNFTPESPLNRLPIKVYYHIPNGDIKTMPILMSFHGSGRDGANHRDFWIAMANANGFMVIAPEYSTSNYPGLGDNYLMSNIFDDGDNPTTATFNDKNEWTFSTLDPLFEYVKEAISGTQENYSAWGHSGGAQFLHRFVTYLPNSKLATAVCSNAGWYTVPENTVDFPYGILNGQLPNEDLTTAFSKKLIVHLGQNDTNTNAGLRRNTIVDDQQGINRLVRGRYYFNTSKDTAEDMDVSFNWQKHEVIGVGHDPQLMANDALQYLLSSLLSDNYFNFTKKLSLFPNPVKNLLTFDNSKIKATNVEIYSINGKLLITNKFSDFSSRQKIDVSKFAHGIYFLKINKDKFSVTKKIIKY
tara:strand:+ start:14804 stop:16543 length:1740 start_codon:yes stop_codon:yes gene_type:complete